MTRSKGTTLRHWPRAEEGETPSEYADRCDVELRVVDIDHATGEVKYAGFGWWWETR